MNKKFITADNIQLTFYEYNPLQKGTIFFIHGNSSSSGVWRKQVESKQLEAYRLITIDLPNHGDSDELDADFSLPAIAKIIGSAINKLINDQPYIICSLSLGTNIVAEMPASDFSPNGLLLAGPCIIGDGFEMDKMALPNVDLTPLFSENLPAERVNKYAEECSLSQDSLDKEIFLADYYSVKGSFRSALYATIASGMFSDEIVLIKKTDVPVCVVFGEEERIVNTSYLDAAPFNIWSNTIYKIPAASHLVNVDAPIAFNELLVTFANDIFKAAFA